MMNGQRRGIGRRVVAGAFAGGIGTVAMDLLLYGRYRREGGKDSPWRWESAEDVVTWDDASAPGRLGEKVERLVTGRQPPEKWARRTTNAVHWATGVAWGLQYGVLTGRSSKHPLLRPLALGPVVWLSGYALLPLAGVYEPIWRYDARTLGKDLSAHLVYGMTTGSTFAALNGRRSA